MPLAASIVTSLAALDQPGLTPSLTLGSHGSLVTAGTFVATPSDQGLVQGSVVAGGTVSLNAQRATLDLQPGSVVDVSGARQVVELANAIGAAVPYRSSVLASNAGTVSITANDAVTLGGAIRGNADSIAAGGSFALTLTDRGDFADPSSGRRIVVTQSGMPVAPDASLKDASVSINKLQQGGFDKLRLTSEDQILFAGNASLRFDRGLTLDSKVIEVGGNGNVMLSSSQATLRNTFGQRVLRNAGDSSDPRTVNDPTQASLPQATRPGDGTFAVNAGTLDLLGSVTISGTSSERLVAQNDLRVSGRAVGSAASPQGAALVGSLTAAGDLLLSAAQIYPTTASRFSIAVADGLTGTPTPGGRIDISASGPTRGAVLSAGGSLTLAADDIVQGGVVKAPLGTLALRRRPHAHTGSGKHDIGLGRRTDHSIRRDAGRRDMDLRGHGQQCADERAHRAAHQAHLAHGPGRRRTERRHGRRLRRRRRRSDGVRAGIGRDDQRADPAQHLRDPAGRELGERANRSGHSPVAKPWLRQRQRRLQQRAHRSGWPGASWQLRPPSGLLRLVARRLRRAVAEGVDLRQSAVRPDRHLGQRPHRRPRRADGVEHRGRVGGDDWRRRATGKRRTEAG